MNMRNSWPMVVCLFLFGQFSVTRAQKRGDAEGSARLQAR
jgi:hypothetical protein